jgi:cytochrome c oxidase subunit 2
MDHLWLPEDVSTYGAATDWLFYLILVITGIAFVATEAALVLFLVKYRARPGHKAHYTHGSHALEVAWTILPAVILVVIALIQRDAWSKIKMEFPAAGNPDVVRVELFAKQFEWRFCYAGADGRFATADDVYSTGDLHVPKGRKVLLKGRSQDVLHSFFVPSLRLKQDIVPGLNMPIWFEATKTSKQAAQERLKREGKPETPENLATALISCWDIACAELCGLGHSRMRGQLVVEEPAEFQAWLVKQKAEFPEPPPPEGRWAWDWDTTPQFKRADPAGGQHK